MTKFTETFTGCFGCSPREFAEVATVVAAVYGFACVVAYYVAEYFG